MSLLKSFLPEAGGPITTTAEANLLLKKEYLKK
jgi:hypothetical protein